MTNNNPLSIDELLPKKFYLRVSKQNSKNKNIIFLIEVDKEKQLLTTVEMESMPAWINDLDKKLKLSYTRPFYDFHFYPLDEEAKEYVEKERDDFIKTTKRGISLRQQEIDKLEKQKNMLQNSI